jgi:hypothetical protein
MKKIILFILLSGFLTTVHSQKQSNQEKKAIVNTDYVANEMKFDDDQKVFLYNVLLDKYEGTSKQIKGKDLTKEEKQVIYKKSNQELNEKLLKEFSKNDVKEIKALLKQQNEKMIKK